MNYRHILRMVVAIGMSAFCAASHLIPAQAARMQPRPRQAALVERIYPGAAPCDTTLQACITGSANGDVIRIAAPATIITDTLTISKPIQLIGGGPSPADVVLQSTSGRVISYSTGTVPLLGFTPAISNLTITGGDAGSDSGGGLRISTSVVVQPLLHSLIISNNKASSGGGVRSTSLAPLTMVNVTVISNTASDTGGGVSVTTTLLLRDSTLSGNTSGGNGGAIFANGAMTMSNVAVISNTSGLRGGGASAGNGTNISGSRFEGNLSTQGGGLYLEFGDGTAEYLIDSTRFIGNIARGPAGVSGPGAAGQGGGVYSALAVTISNSRFENNEARGGDGDVIGAPSPTFGNGGAGSGGGLYASSHATVIGSQFYTNTARGGLGPIFAGGPVSNSLPGASFGGGMRINGVATLSDTLLSGNQAIAADLDPAANAPLLEGGDASGGGLYGSRIVIRNTRFEFNLARGGKGDCAPAVLVCDTDGSGSGGGVHSTNASDIASSTFFSNTASDNGGGVALQEGTVVHTQFTQNKAEQRGGALKLSVGLVTARQITLTQNLGVYGGGGIIIESIGSVRLTESALISNTAGNGQGNALIVVPSGGAAYIGNSLILDVPGPSNSDAINVGGVGSAAQLVNNTFIGAGGGSSLGQLRTQARAASFTNNIIVGFRYGISSTILGTVNESHNLFFNNSVASTFGTTSGGGSFIADPRFVNPAAGNYHITGSSPAANAGTTSDLTVDYDGQNRPWSSSDRVDIGFDEIDPATIVRYVYLPMMSKR
jgi:hypothetical protein